MRKDSQQSFSSEKAFTPNQPSRSREAFRFEPGGFDRGNAFAGSRLLPPPRETGAHALVLKGNLRNAALVPVGRSRQTPARENAPVAQSRVLVVDYCSDAGVDQHPALQPWLRQSWRVERARPRVTPEGAKLLVVLSRSRHGSKPGARRGAIAPTQG